MASAELMPVSHEMCATFDGTLSSILTVAMTTFSVLC